MKDDLIKKIENYIIETLEPPRSEYHGLPACPFVKKDRLSGNLWIDVFDNNEESIIEKVQKFDESDYKSAVFGQDLPAHLSQDDALEYQTYINRLLNNNGLEHLKAICANPTDDLHVLGFNVRSKAPCFLITITTKEDIWEARAKMYKTKYFNSFNERYLKYLQVDKKKLKKPK